ncbi:MAG: aldehyde dehydrogenase family protein, partial [Fimbriimonadaceae bacterium]
VGPIFGVVPYNWPYNLAAHKIAPALASGNTIVIRPSKRSPLSTLLLARLIHEAGCPDGVVNVLNCGHDEAELAMKDDRIKKLSFTGSPAVGWKLKELVPRKKVSLELGGNAYAVVREDADLDWAIPRIAQGGFLYAGQICISVQNVRIEKSVYEKARERLVEETKKIKYGDPMDDDVICGPVIDLDAGDKIMDWLDEAESAGAEIIAGGNRTGSVVEPTLIENVPTDKKAVCEEIFGPVLTVAPFDSYDEVLAEINSSQFGIHTGVFTDSIVSAHKAFDELDVAGVIVNDFPTLRFDNFPYGGVKNSGFGREGVKYAMQEMTELKTMVTKVR